MKKSELRQLIREELSSIDTITMDVPLFIRMLEYAKEDAKTDMDLHDATEKALELSKTSDTLTMKNYAAIVGQTKTEIKESVDVDWHLAENVLAKFLEKQTRQLWTAIKAKESASIPRIINDIISGLRNAGRTMGLKVESTSKKPIKEALWPLSKLGDSFVFRLHDELRKKFPKYAFWGKGYDLYMDDHKIMTINGDKDSINSVVDTVKKIVGR